MAVNSRFIQVHPDAIIEWIWDDQFFYEDEYSIIKDVKNNETSFSFASNANDPLNYNKIPNQLYLVDSVINKFGIADPTVKPFLQETQYVNNQPSKFNKIKIWFPIYYTFPNSTGFYLRTYALNYENAVKYNLSNYFMDITIPGELTKIENEAKPFRLNEKLWGKSITLYVPSTYDEALNRINNAPTLGTINYNLTSGILGLSQTTPIYIDFRFLTSKSTILGETTYLTTPPLVTNIPQAPEYNNLGVQITQATDGDYFVINGTFNNSIGEFESFMSALEENGKRSYILYAITVYEENIPQDTREIYVYKDFYKGIDDYRPVLKFSNTTASIRVDMKLISSVDSSVVTKTAEYTLIGNQVSKYGKYVTPINITGAIKPKLYNSKPDQIVLPSKELLNSHLRRKKTKQEIRFVPYPILTSVFNIVAQEATLSVKNNNYYGYGDLTINLTPFDNVIKLVIAKKSSENSIEPFIIPSSNSIVQMIFKSPTSELRIPLYLESNEVNLSNGVVVFKIPSVDQEKIKKIYAKNKNFYITITSNGIETVIYDGLFRLLSDTTRRPLREFLNINLPVIKNKLPALKPVLNNIVPVSFNKLNTLDKGILKQLNSNALNTNQLKKII